METPHSTITLQTLTSRVLAMTRDAGQWGKVMSSIMLLTWGISALFDKVRWDAIMAMNPQWCQGCIGWWLIFASIAPLAAVMTNTMWLMVLTASTSLITWFFILFEAVLTGSMGHPAFGASIAGVLGMMNAEAKLAQRVYSGDG